MFLSNYVAKIASWVYNATAYNVVITPTQSIYLNDLNSFTLFNNIFDNVVKINLTYLNTLIYVIIIIIVLLLLSSCVTTNTGNKSTVNNSITFLQLIEDELSSGTKLIYAYITLFSYVVWFSFYSYLGVELPWIVGLLPLYASLLMFLLFGIPLMLLINYKAFFMAYIRGNVGLKPLLMELVLDYINLIASFLRFNIQLIRILIITAIFFLYNELFEEFIYPNYSGELSLDINVTNLMLIFVNILYEVGHFWIIFGMQSSAILFILTMLFQFLYTQVFLNKFQSVFSIKRSNF